MNARFLIYDALPRHGKQHVLNQLKDWVKKTGGCAICVDYVHSDGTVRDATAHSTDTVLVLTYPKDGEDETGRLRILRVEKNRHGSEQVKSYWKVTDAGALAFVKEE